jgi:type II secretory ATPase GspE/PulE/Tfp pilus assembly ATPase PilB-like protein
LALELIRRTLEGKMPTLELKPKDPAAEARARGEEAMTIYGELKGNTYLQAVQRFKELAGLKPDETGTAQAGAFDCEFAGRKYRFTVNVTPEPPREAVRVSMEPAEN